MSQTMAKEGDLSKRQKRAQERFLQLVYDDDNTKMVRKEADDGSWGDAHVLTTADGDAVDCSCPDSQIRGEKCYHQWAWDMWTFDEVLFEDGELVQL